MRGSHERGSVRGSTGRVKSVGKRGGRGRGRGAGTHVSPDPSQEWVQQESQRKDLKLKSAFKENDRVSG